MKQPAIAVSFSQTGHGWADCTLTFGEQPVSLRGVSHTSDVLGELLRATLNIAAGGYLAEASFDREPAEWRIVLQHGWEGVPQQRVFRVRVLEFPNSYAEEPIASGHEVIAVECDVLAFSEAVAAEASRFLARAGPTGAVSWWEQPFPFRAFAALKAAIAETRDA